MNVSSKLHVCIYEFRCICLLIVSVKVRVFFVCVCDYQKKNKENKTVDERKVLEISEYLCLFEVYFSVDGEAMQVSEERLRKKMSGYKELKKFL